MPQCLLLLSWLKQEILQWKYRCPYIWWSFLLHASNVSYIERQSGVRPSFWAGQIRKSRTRPEYMYNSRTCLDAVRLSLVASEILYVHSLNIGRACLGFWSWVQSENYTVEYTAWLYVESALMLSWVIAGGPTCYIYSSTHSLNIGHALLLSCGDAGDPAVCTKYRACLTFELGEGRRSEPGRFVLSLTDRDKNQHASFHETSAHGTWWQFQNTVKGTVDFAQACDLFFCARFICSGRQHKHRFNSDIIIKRSLHARSEWYVPQQRGG